METIRPEQLKAIDLPLDGEVPTYNSDSQQFEWIVASGTSGSGVSLEQIQDNLGGTVGGDGFIKTGDGHLTIVYNDATPALILTSIDSIDYAPTAIEFGNSDQEYDIDGTTWVTAIAGGTLGGIPNLTAGHTLADCLSAIATSRDGHYLAVREKTGAPSPTNPNTVHFLFTGVNHFDTIKLRSRYVGTPAHTIAVQLWNYTTSTWDTYATFSSEADYESRSVEIFSDSLYISGGNIKLQFIHQSVGSASHYYLFDYVILSDGGGGTGGTQFASAITFTPAGNISATNVQAAIEELDTEKPTTFLGLTDTPDSYTGQALKYPRVNTGENALEFVTISGSGGTLAGLTDVSVSGVLDGQFLAYSSALAKWIPASGLSGGYVATYFDEDDTSDILHILTSMDGLNWTDLNVVFPEDARDPSITFYNNKWWIAHTKHGSPTDEIPIYSSDDLETWTNVVDLDTSVMGNPGPDAWSPEWFIDTDSSVHLLIAGDDYPQHKIYETHPTNDAWTTWSNLIEITGTGFPTDMIDPFIVKVGSTYNLFYKDDNTDYICLATSTSLLSDYTEVRDGDWAGWGGNREGECIFRTISGGWRAYFNTTLTNGQYYSDSNDLDAWTDPVVVSDMVNLSHGTIYMTNSFATYLDMIRLLNIGGVEEAPIDGNFYIRKDASWNQLSITTSGVLTGQTVYVGTTISGVIVPTGGQANVDFTNIPSTYDEILIYIVGKTEKVADKYDKVYISLNNDTNNANYERELLYGGQDTPSEDSATDRAICSLPGSAGYIGISRIHIPDYTGSFRKVLHTMGGTNYGGIDTYVENYFLAWSNTAAITRITLTPVSGTDFAEGTIIKLIGFKDTVVGGDGGATTLNDLTDVNTTGVTDGQALTYDGDTSTWIPSTISGSGGTFLELTDTPNSYVGEAGRLVKVNSTEDGLDFTIASGAGATNFLDLIDTPDSYAGQAGKVLVVTSGATGVGFSSALGYYAGTQIWRQVIGAGGSASVDISSISDTYDYLELTIIGKTERSIDIFDNIRLTVNNDTTDGNYHSDRVYAGDTTHGLTEYDTRNIGDFPGVNGKIGMLKTIIPYYSNTSFYKNYHTNVSIVFSDTDSYVMEFSTFWKSTAAINRLTISAISGSDLAEGTLILLVGYKNTTTPMTA